MRWKWGPEAKEEIKNANEALKHQKKSNKSPKNAGEMGAGELKRKNRKCKKKCKKNKCFCVVCSPSRCRGACSPIEIVVADDPSALCVADVRDGVELRRPMPHPGAALSSGERNKNGNQIKGEMLETKIKL